MPPAVAGLGRGRRAGGRGDRDGQGDGREDHRRTHRKTGCVAVSRPRAAAPTV